MTALVLAAPLVMAATSARSQERAESIVDMLFGGGSRDARPASETTPREANPRPAPEPVRPEPEPSSEEQGAPSEPAANVRSDPGATGRPDGDVPAEASAEAPEAAEAEPAAKQETARKILVVGDFLASSLADGLEQTYADAPQIAIVPRANGSSGLVREDFYDWSETLGPIIDEVEPDAVAVMIGANDRQAIRVPGTSLAVRSDGWTAEYEKRATDIARIAEDRDVPLVWVGMPSFRFDSMSEDMVFFNDIYRRAAERAGGEFVSVWDGFVDQEGEFVSSGPDVNGQTVRLRGSDGLNMTDAGDEKLGFFAKKALDRVLGQTEGEPVAGTEPLSPGEAQPMENVASATATPPVSLDDPEGVSEDALIGAGSRTRAAALELSPRDRLIVNGEANDAQIGRADNFAWNEKSNAIPREPAILYRGSIDLRTIEETSGIRPPEEMPSILDAIIEDWENQHGDASE